MFTPLDIQNGESTPSLLNSEVNHNIIISFSLLMRLMEWCKEDVDNDVQMHKAMEKIVSFSDGLNPLTMDVYDIIVADTESSSNSYQEEYTEYTDEAYEEEPQDNILNQLSFEEPVHTQLVIGEEGELEDTCCLQHTPHDTLMDEIEQIINIGKIS